MWTSNIDHEPLSVLRSSIVQKFIQKVDLRKILTITDICLKQFGKLFNWKNHISTLHNKNQVCWNLKKGINLISNFKQGINFGLVSVVKCGNFNCTPPIQLQNFSILHIWPCLKYKTHIWPCLKGLTQQGHYLLQPFMNDGSDSNLVKKMKITRSLLAS